MTSIEEETSPGSNGTTLVTMAAVLDASLATVKQQVLAREADLLLRLQQSQERIQQLERQVYLSEHSVKRKAHVAGEGASAQAEEGHGEQPQPQQQAQPQPQQHADDGNDTSETSERFLSFDPLESVEDTPLELLQQLGAGGYGAVYAARLGPFDVAVKQLRLTSGGGGDGAAARGDGEDEPVEAVKDWATALQEAQTEVAILAMLSHDGIVRYVGHERSANMFAVIMERMPAALGEYLIERFVDGNAIPESNAAFVSNKIASALHYLHTHESGVIIHRDVKSQNVLIRIHGDRIVDAKLCDFGVAVVVTDPGDASKLIGTTNYLAPEIAHGKVPYTQAVDVWSYAMLVGEIVTMTLPYSGLTEDLILAKIRSGTPPSMARVSFGYPNLTKLIDRCARRDPEDRFTTAQILEFLERARRRRWRNDW